MDRNLQGSQFVEWPTIPLAVFRRVHDILPDERRRPGPGYDHSGPIASFVRRGRRTKPGRPTEDFETGEGALRIKLEAAFPLEWEVMMAEGTARRTTAAARGADEGEGQQLLPLAWGDMEGLIRANQTLIDRTSELSRAWLACWQEQLAEGMELAREVLDRQGTFVRTSLERLNAQVSQSAELASGMVDGYIAPLRESAGKAAKQTTGPAA
jgi:hypothetical protein